MGRSFQIDVLEVCDPYEFNLTRESPRHIDPHRSLMSGLKKDLREVVQKQNGTPPPCFRGKWEVQKISFLMILAPLKASIYALEGGEALSHSNGSTGVNKTQVATPSFHAKSGLFCP